MGQIFPKPPSKETPRTLLVSASPRACPQPGAPPQLPFPAAPPNARRSHPPPEPPRGKEAGQQRGDPGWPLEEEHEAGELSSLFLPPSCRLQDGCRERSSLLLSARREPGAPRGTPSAQPGSWGREGAGGQQTARIGPKRRCLPAGAVAQGVPHQRPHCVAGAPG